MRISKPQQFRFFREWQSIVRSNDWSHAQAETERHALIERAGFSSLKDVDHTHGYTAVLKELAALNEDLSGMLQADANGRRTMIWKIKHTVGENYWQKIARDRFGTDDLDALKDEQLKQLLFTVSDRTVQAHLPATVECRRNANRRRRATPDPEARIKFPDLPAVPKPEYASDNAPF